MLLRLVGRLVLIVMLANLFIPSVLASSTERYITAGGTITEIVFALGAGNKVVAVDQSSTFPVAATKLPQIGYYRDLAVEGILSQGASTLLALEGAGRANVLEQVEQVGLKVKIFSKPESIEQLYQLIEQLGNLLAKNAEAEKLINTIKASLPEKKALNRKAVFLLSAGNRGLIAAGTNTVPNLLFDYAGIKNVAAQYEGYKAINIENLVLQNPDFIVVPSHTLASAGGKEKYCQQSILALLLAAQKCQVLIMDGLKALGMTTRLAEAIAELTDYAQKVSTPVE